MGHAVAGPLQSSAQAVHHGVVRPHVRDAGQGVEGPRGVVEAVGAGGGGREDDEAIDKQGPTAEAVQDGGDDEDAVLAVAEGYNLDVLDERVRVGHVGAHGEGGQRVQQDDAQRDLARADLDRLLGPQVPVLCCRDGDGLESDQPEQARVKRVPDRTQLRDAARGHVPVGQRHVRRGKGVGAVVRPHGPSLDRLPNLEDDVEDDHKDNEGHLDEPEDVLEATQLSNRQHVDQEHDDQEAEDVDGGRDIGVELERRVGVAGLGEALGRIPELENVRDGHQLGRDKDDPGEPGFLVRDSRAC